MKINLNRSDAVTALHNSGFTDDFQLVGNDLLWVQGKIIIRKGEFVIVECHIISEPKKKFKEIVVYGIVAPFHCTKGILLHGSFINNRKK